MRRQPARGAGPQSEVCRELKTAGFPAIGPLGLMAEALAGTGGTRVALQLPRRRPIHAAACPPTDGAAAPASCLIDHRPIRGSIHAAFHSHPSQRTATGQQPPWVGTRWKANGCGHLRPARARSAEGPAGRKVNRREGPPRGPRAASYPLLACRKAVGRQPVRLLCKETRSHREIRTRTTQVRRFPVRRPGHARHLAGGSEISLKRLAGPHRRAANGRGSRGDLAPVHRALAAFAAGFSVGIGRSRCRWTKRGGGPRIRGNARDLPPRARRRSDPTSR
jgi:hypothetical protein